MIHIQKSAGDPADVAETHGRRERGRKGLEVVDRAGVRRIVVLAADDRDAVGHRVVLDELRPEGEEDARPHEHEERPRPPHEAAYFAEEIDDCLHVGSVVS
jgi:hypothetical protein